MIPLQSPIPLGSPLLSLLSLRLLITASHKGSPSETDMPTAHQHGCVTLPVTACSRRSHTHTHKLHRGMGQHSRPSGRSAGLSLGQAAPVRKTVTKITSPSSGKSQVDVAEVHPEEPRRSVQTPKRETSQ